MQETFLPMKQISGNKSHFRITGVMSGTSMDGLDIAACEFIRAPEGWQYRIIAAETIGYPDDMSAQLDNSFNMDATGLIHLDRQYGDFIGNKVADFHQKQNFHPDLVSSHGHTVFHRPGEGYTLQVGHGANIAARCGLPVAFDFRSSDVAYGGEGAPLVPVGDHHLFGNFEYCLNLGGFTNISFDQDGIRKAGDICPLNIVTNRIAQILGRPYDYNGDIGKRGQVIHELLDELNNLEFYSLPIPRSLGREYIEEVVWPLLMKYASTPQNLLRTWYEHAAMQIGLFLKPGGKVLVTGGGAFNRYFIERLTAYSVPEIVIPDVNLVNYKEALIFAFLGLLRLLNEPNCIGSVTGASKDATCGMICLP